VKTVSTSLVAQPSHLSLHQPPPPEEHLGHALQNPSNEL